MCKDICRISRIHIYFVEYADTQNCLYRLTTIIHHLYFQRSLFTKYIIVLVQFDTDIQSLFGWTYTKRSAMGCIVPSNNVNSAIPDMEIPLQESLFSGYSSTSLLPRSRLLPHLPQQINVLFRHPFCLGNHKLHPFLIVLQ